MATYSRIPFSASTDGRGIKVAASATPGTTIHAASGTSNVRDEIFVWAVHSGSATELLTFEVGGTTDPDDLIEVNILPTGEGLKLVLPGLILQNSLELAAFSASGNVISLFGFVNRQTP